MPLPLCTPYRALAGPIRASHVQHRPAPALPDGQHDVIPGRPAADHVVEAGTTGGAAAARGRSPTIEGSVIARIYQGQVLFLGSLSDA